MALAIVGVCVVNKVCGWPEESDTINEAVALVRPLAETVIVALPVVLGVSVAVALPPAGATGEDGLKDPDTPATPNVIGLVAAVTGLPLASWIVAV